ncbi:MAG: cupredoxin domain-containing protein [Minisyncoccia bacterium]
MIKMKAIIISIIITVVFIGGSIFFTKGKFQTEINTQVQTQTSVESTISTGNVSIENGKQIISITARGGYSPRVNSAKAGIPTVLRFITNKTFDCSSFVQISSININKMLPQTGTTDIDLGSPRAGIFYGTCGMGMYSFEINFQN